MKSLLIRCDANEENGYGHFSRCLNIARGIMAFNPFMVVTFLGEFTQKAQSLLNKYQFPFIEFSQHQNDNAENIQPHLKTNDVVLVDSYKISQKYIDGLCGNSYKVAIMDELYKYDFSKTDLVINFCIDAIKHDYLSKDQALGIGYFPNKPELKRIREGNLTKQPKNEVENILVTIGGHDLYKIGDKIILELDSIVSNKKITYITSDKASLSLKTINNHLTIIPFSEAIEELYAACDTTITAGGLMKYESAFCCIPNGNIPQTLIENNDSDFFEISTLSLRINKAYDYQSLKTRPAILSLLNIKQRLSLFNNYKCEFLSNSLDNIVTKIIR